jgi:hypothetical protein
MVQHVTEALLLPVKRALLGQGARPSRPLLTALAAAGVVLASAFVGLRVYSLPLKYLLVLLAGAALALIALRDMSHGLSLLVFGATAPFAFGTGTQSDINGAMLLVALLTGLWVVRMAVSGRIRLARTPLNGPLLSFLATAGVSWVATNVVLPPSIVLPSNTFVVQAGQFAVFALTAAAFLLAANHPVSDQVLKVWTGFIVVAGSGIMLGRITGGWGAVRGWSGALYMWPVVLLVAQMLFNSKMRGWLKMLGLAAIGLWGYWAASTGISWKSGWAPAAGAILLLLLLKSRRLFLVILVVLAALVFAVGPERVSSALLAGEEASASPIRWNLWLDIFRLGARSWVFGLGPAVYRHYWFDPGFRSWSYEYVDPWAFARDVYAPPAHNMYADIFAQTGAVGLLLFLWVVAGGIRLGIRAIRRPLSPFGAAYARGVLCGFVALAAASFVFAEWLLPYVYNLGLAGFRHSMYAWVLLGTLVWLGRPASPRGGGGESSTRTAAS